MEKNKKFIIYKITNLINSKVYVGAHITYDVNDRYMGSSNYLKRDLKKIGRKNFEKTPLHIFDNKKDMMKMEAEIVNKEFCYRDDTYNRIIGGLESFSNEGMVTVVNPEGGHMNVYVDDPRYISGKLKHVRSGKKLSKEHKNAWQKAMKEGADNDGVKKRISDTLKNKYDRGEISHKGEKRSKEFIEDIKARRIKEVKDGSDKRSKRVGQYNKEGNLVSTWNSIGEAEREGGYTKSSIIIACKDNTRTHKKHYWRYL